MTNAKAVLVKSKKYQCFCTKCSNSWSSSSKPKKCPSCGSAAITYSDLKNMKSRVKEKSIVVSLSLSADGKSIVDDQGNEIARFRDGLTVTQSQKASGLKLPGHWKCDPECIAWDKNGKCVKSVMSCTWVFPPFDF